MRLRIASILAGGTMWLASATTVLSEPEPYGEVACYGPRGHISYAISKSRGKYVLVVWEGVDGTVAPVEKTDVFVDKLTVKFLFDGAYFEWDADRPQPNGLWVTNGEITQGFCAGFLENDYKGEVLTYSPLSAEGTALIDHIEFALVALKLKALGAALEFERDKSKSLETQLRRTEEKLPHFYRED